MAHAAGVNSLVWVILEAGKRPNKSLRQSNGLGDQVAKGYLQENFIDTFRRYIPKSEVDALKAEMEEGLKKEGIKPPTEESSEPGQPKE
ncbi:MAG TPA: hypothetical protein VN578_08295 [Candidatus Binatia bacterium]|nr:hypothetical protein [Candidatus Binatia bacterium]